MLVQIIQNNKQYPSIGNKMNYERFMIELLFWKDLGLRVK